MSALEEDRLFILLPDRDVESNPIPITILSVLLSEENDERLRSDAAVVLVVVV